MKKLIRNIINLISIDTPYFIIINYIKNYFPNYRKKKECLKIENSIYSNFKSEDISKKWFTNNLYFIKKNLANTKIKNLLEIGSYEGRSALFFWIFLKLPKFLVLILGPVAMNTRISIFMQSKIILILIPNLLKKKKLY